MPREIIDREFEDLSERLKAWREEADREQRSGSMDYYDVDTLLEITEELMKIIKPS